MFISTLIATACALAACSQTSRITGEAIVRPYFRLQETHQLSVTNHVLPLVAAPHHHLLPPSSKYLQERRRTKRSPPVVNASREEDSLANSTSHNVTDIQASLQTIRGRIYLTNITLAGKEYTLVIDTGSSDTWIASSTFKCIPRFTKTLLPAQSCGFLKLFDETGSKTWEPVDTHKFRTAYADGEYLSGVLGTEEFGIGGVNEDQLKTRQMIGVAKRGWWDGDGISSGLLGLAYPTMVSNAQDLNYTSVIFSLLQDATFPPVFSLALSRPTLEDQTGGGLLALGGIPDVAHDNDFVTVPIHPIAGENVFTFYAIPVDGFEIISPGNTSSKSPSSPPSSASAAALIAEPPHARRQDRQSKNHRKRIRYSTPGLDMVVDSGTSQIVLPGVILKRIVSLFSPPAVFDLATQAYRVSCTSAAPRLGVVIAGKTFYIHANDLVNDPLGLGGEGDSCTIAVQKSKHDFDYVLGDPWMKNVLAVFDVGRNEMRFAAREYY